MKKNRILSKCHHQTRQRFADCQCGEVEAVWDLCRGVKTELFTQQRSGLQIRWNLVFYKKYNFFASFTIKTLFLQQVNLKLKQMENIIIGADELILWLRKNGKAENVPNDEITGLGQ